MGELRHILQSTNLRNYKRLEIQKEHTVIDNETIKVIIAVCRCSHLVFATDSSHCIGTSLRTCSKVITWTIEMLYKCLTHTQTSNPHDRNMFKPGLGTHQLLASLHQSRGGKMVSLSAVGFFVMNTTKVKFPSIKQVYLLLRLNPQS